MCSSGQLCSASGRPPPNSARDGANNSGSQYALCALGVGLVVLGGLMIVWSVVPSTVPRNSSGSGSGSSGGGSKPGHGNTSATAKGNTASVAFVLAGLGVVMLFLSICLGVRSKQRQQRAAQAADARLEEQERETEETATNYDVPTYEEAVGSGQYPLPPPTRQPSSNSESQLPSYEDLVDNVRHEDEETPSGAGPLPGVGPQPSPAGAAPTSPQPAAAAPAPANRQNGLSRMLRPPKVRRIKSEKLRLKNISNVPQPGPLSIEPLTPPPQYDEQLPRI